MFLSGEENTFFNPADSEIKLPSLGVNLAKISKVTIVACGSSYFAGLVAKFWIERYARVSVEVDISSEFRYRETPLPKDGLTLFISQSGESIDTLMAMRQAKKLNLKTTAIVNVEGSTIDREADYSLYTRVGPEIGVASTKSFTSQLTVLFLIAIKLANENKTINHKEYQSFIKLTKSLPNSLSKCLKMNDEIIDIAQKIKNTSNTIFLGRGYLYPLALEGALKLKEISYIHAEGYPAAEMKHGPIALIDSEMPIVVIATKKANYDKVLSNIQEVKARGGRLIAIVTEGDELVKELADFCIEIPNCLPELAPLVANIPLQLLSYYIALLRGCDVDQPRNLAKSVTVE